MILLPCKSVRLQARALFVRHARDVRAQRAHLDPLPHLTCSSATASGVRPLPAPVSSSPEVRRTAAGSALRGPAMSPSWAKRARCLAKRSASGTSAATSSSVGRPHMKLGGIDGGAAMPNSPDEHSRNPDDITSLSVERLGLLSQVAQRFGSAEHKGWRWFAEHSPNPLWLSKSCATQSPRPYACWMPLGDCSQ
jgi:hypothetical protein